MNPKEAVVGIYQVGGSGLTDPADCSVYLLRGEPCVLIDAGAGASASDILCEGHYGIIEVKKPSEVYPTASENSGILKWDGAFFR